MPQKESNFFEAFLLNLAANLEFETHYFFKILCIIICQNKFKLMIRVCFLNLNQLWIFAHQLKNFHPGLLSL